MTATVTYKDGKLTVSSKDLLEDWKKKNGDAKKYLSVAPFLIRVEILLGGLKEELLNSKAKVMQESVKSAAGNIQKEMDKALDKLLKELKALTKVPGQDNNAEDKAKTLVDGTEKELKRELPDFGHSIRKAVEKALGCKLPGSVRSTSSGGFKGLELTYEFTDKEEKKDGVDKRFADVYTGTAKTLTDASKTAVKQCRLLDTARDRFKKALDEAQKETEGQHRRLDELIKERDLAKNREEFQRSAYNKICHTSYRDADQMLKGTVKPPTDKQQRELWDRWRTAMDAWNNAEKQLQAPRDSVNALIQKRAKTLRTLFEEHAGQAAKLKALLEQAEKGVQQKMSTLLGKGEQGDRNAINQAASELEDLQAKLGARKNEMLALVRECLPKSDWGWDEWKKHLALVRGGVQNLCPLADDALKFAKWAETAEKKAKEVGN